MDKKDITLQKQARNYFGKHGIDLRTATVIVSYGTCFVSGKIDKLPKENIPNLKERTEFVSNLIKQINGIKDVILHCDYQ